MYQGVGVAQQPGTTVVVVQQPNRYGNYPWANRTPLFMRNGLQMGGVMISAPLIMCLGMFGVFFTFGGIMFMATDAGEDFWAKFDRTHGPGFTAGAFFLVIGLCLITTSIIVACIAKKKYESMRKNNQDNPGRVVNQNPGNYEPGGAPPYGMNPGAQVPAYPPGGINNPPMGGYPAGQPPMGSYPAGQPPMGSYPAGQPPMGSYPAGQPPMGSYPTEQPPPYPAQPGPNPAGASQTLDYDKKPYPFPEGSQQPSDPYGKSGQYEYNSPPPFAPDFKP